MDGNDEVTITFTVEITMARGTKAWEIERLLNREARETLVFGEHAEPFRGTRGQIAAELFSRSWGSRGIPHGVQVGIRDVAHSVPGPPG